MPDQAAPKEARFCLLFEFTGYPIATKQKLFADQDSQLFLLQASSPLKDISRLEDTDEFDVVVNINFEGKEHLE